MSVPAGHTIGDSHIVCKIGEGGMGVVREAEGVLGTGRE